MATDYHEGDRLGPGIYSRRGELHVDEAEFIRGAGGDPEDPEDVAAARHAIARVAGKHGIPTVEAP
jgi:hypothetical protein